MDAATVIVIAAAIILLLSRKVPLVSATYQVSPEQLRIFRERIASYEKYIEDYGDPAWSTAVGPDLIRAIIWTESSGDRNATQVEWNNEVSRGLMQITVPAAADVGFRDRGVLLMDPRTNIKYGAAYLWKLFCDFGGREAAGPALDTAILDTISAYNAGATTVNTRKSQGLGYNNPQYVARVLSYHKALRGEG